MCLNTRFSSGSIGTMQHSNVSVIEQRPTLRRQAAAAVGSNGHVIARDTAMREILCLVKKIAYADVPVLILGEIGVGKQTIAREIHRQSPHSARPFVHVVCGSLRESDLQERLFGQSWDCSGRDKGPQASLLESSQGGTLFFDGVAQLPLWAQVKVLDALQCRSGRNRENGNAVATPARVIASDTCDLETAVVENRFYSGLYYYLNPSTSTFCRCDTAKKILSCWRSIFWRNPSACFSPRGQLPRRFSEEARESLLQCDWPGNVLQLAAVVAHAAMLAEGPEIDQACVAGLLGSVRQHVDSETISVPLAGGLKDMELALINEVIRRCRGNKAEAARALKLHRRTLYRLLEK